jgi:hypothetical protein
MRYIWINNNLDMINIFFDKLMNFIYKNDNEIIFITDEETLFNYFCEFLYDNYILNNYNSDIDYNNNYNNNFEYFDYKYCSDIIDLFIEFKDISYGFTNNIFKYNNLSNNLLEFIYKNIELNDDFEYYEENSDEEY